MNKLIKEFKEFVMRGNVIDMAVGVIIGGAFNNIVSSLVNDIVMPVITLITGRIDFSNLMIALDGNHYSSLEEAKNATSVIAYGNFIQIVVQFLLTAFVIFMVDWIPVMRSFNSRMADMFRSSIVFGCLDDAIF